MNLKSVNPWLILAVMCLPVFVGSLDLTVVSAFLPELIVQLEIPLQSGLDDASWIITAYLLADVITLTFMGRVSDLIGRRKVYIACLAIFTVGSLIVGFAHTWPTDLLFGFYRRLGEYPDRGYLTLQVVIFGRVIQAIGAGALVPITLALVGDLFPPNQRARPLGVIGAVDTIGWMLGHLYGGVLVQFVAWQWLFLINIPLMAIVLVAILWALRKVEEHPVQGRFDFVGTLTLIGALTLFNLGLGTNLDIGSVTSNFSSTAAPILPFVMPLLLAGAICFLVFVWIEARVRDPLIDLRLFRNRAFSAGLLVNLVVGYTLFIGLVIVPILVNIRSGEVSTVRDAALATGLLLSALTIPMALASFPGGWLGERIGHRIVTLIGLSVSACGFLLIWQTWTPEISDTLIIVQMALIGVGLGLTFSPVSTTVLNAAGKGQLGVASGLVIIVRQIGMTISVSSLTTFALQRVYFLAAAELGQLATGDPALYPEVWIRVTVGVLGELGLLGAVLCGLALIPAGLMGSRSSRDKINQNGYSSEQTELQPLEGVRR
ncbi:MAG: MFS transporter [Anaerolineae bacterium]|jgi:MFS family permease|nr:MFS transporter [Anaerolineae bacterium]